MRLLRTMHGVVVHFGQIPVQICNIVRYRHTDFDALRYGFPIKLQEDLPGNIAPKLAFTAQGKQGPCTFGVLHPGVQRVILEHEIFICP